jgi:hypothetical protein
MGQTRQCWTTRWQHWPGHGLAAPLFGAWKLFAAAATCILTAPPWSWFPSRLRPPLYHPEFFVFHLFIPAFLKSNSISPNHLNLGLPLSPPPQVCLPATQAANIGLHNCTENYFSDSHAYNRGITKKALFIHSACVSGFLINRNYSFYPQISTLQWCWSLNSNYWTRWTICIFILSLNSFMTYGAPKQETLELQYVECNEIYNSHWRINTVISYQFYLQIVDVWGATVPVSNVP